MPTLEQQQQGFAASLIDRVETQEILNLFKPLPDLQQRLALYRGNLKAIWIATLSQAYPVLLQLVGSAYFEQIAPVYARACPSQTGNLAEFGHDFADFLQAQTEIASYPYLPDVARLEWLLHRSYYAKENPVLDLPALARWAHEQGVDPMTLSLGWQGYAEIFASDYAVASIWQCLQESNPGQDDLSSCDWRQGECILISRHNWQSQPRSLTQAEYAALSALRGGQTLGAAMEAALSCDPEFEIASRLQAWFADELFYSIHN